MSDCRVCSAPITWAVVAGGPDEGLRVPLDDHEQRDYGPGRYRITADSIPPKIEAIGDESPLRTFVDHRVLCQQPRAI